MRGSALGAARVVLLTDGDDVGSTTSLDAAIAQLNAQKIRVYTVGIESPDFTPDDLQQLADKTGGTYAAATSPEALTKIYDELGFQLGNEYLLRYRSNARPDQKVDVEVAVKGAEPVSFAYTSPSTGTAAPYKPALRDRLLQSWFLIPLVVWLMLALVVFTLRSLWSLRSNKALVARLGDFVTLPAEERAAERRKEVDELLAAVGQQKKQRRNFRWMEGFSEDVDVAQIKHDPSRMVWASVLAGLLVAVFAGVVFSPFWAVLGVVPPIALNLVVRGKARKVRKDFGEQLPENLDVLASALRAGHSLAGAMGVVADEAPEPSKREFRRVVTDEQLGIPLDEALEVTAQRMQNSDIDQLAVLALVQREAGGNTAEVLDQVTTNIRARMDVRRLVTVLTAQGKFSAVVVGLVPLGHLLLPDAGEPLPPRSAVPPDARPGGRHQRDLHDPPGLLHHPSNRHDRALRCLTSSLSSSGSSFSRSPSRWSSGRSSPRPARPRRPSSRSAPTASRARSRPRTMTRARGSAPAWTTSRHRRVAT